MVCTPVHSTVSIFYSKSCLDLQKKFLSDGIVKAGKIAVADFICPTKAARKQFNADFIVWMDTIKEGRFEDTNKMFESLERDEYDYHVSGWFDDTHKELVKVVSKYMERNNVKI